MRGLIPKKIARKMYEFEIYLWKESSESDNISDNIWYLIILIHSKFFISSSMGNPKRFEKLRLYKNIRYVCKK